MTAELEHARERLQEILSELEQAYRNGQCLDSRKLDEMNRLVRFLHDNGLGVATVRDGNKLVVEFEPLVGVAEHEWAA